MARHPLAQQRPVVAAQQLLRLRELEQQRVPGLLAVGDRALHERRRVSDGQHGQPLHAFWRHQRERPRDARAPVVPDDVRALHLQRVQNRDRVRDAVANAIVVDRFRLVGLAEPAQVGRDHAQSGAGERRDLVAPEPRGVGESVQQEHRRTLALVEY